MLYGLSLLYGMTGTTSLPGDPRGPGRGPRPTRTASPLYVIALLVFAGFGFKTAAVPFHFWCPDVYQGAPTPVTAFLSVAPKAAGFAIMLRFFFGGLATAGAGAWDLAGHHRLAARADAGLGADHDAWATWPRSPRPT